MSDDLIDRLVADAAPVPRNALKRRLAVAGIIGAIVAAVIMVPWIGLRPDIATAYANPTFWMKFAYTLIFALLAFWAAERLSRPAGSIRLPLLGIFALVALTGIAGIVQMMMSGPGQMRQLVMGGTALICPFYIVTLSVPIYAVTILVMRRFAPTNLTLAGFAAGLMAGAAATWVYAFHCGESGLPFITLWYTTGILVTAFIGAAIGRFALRW
jgi:hypothetical protein